MPQWLPAKSLRIVPRDEWSVTPRQIRKFLLHPNGVSVDSVSVSLLNPYPRPAGLSTAGRAWNVWLAQSDERGLRRLNRDNNAATTISSDHEGTVTLTSFEPMDPDLPVYVVVNPNSVVGTGFAVPPDFGINVTVRMLAESAQ